MEKLFKLKENGTDVKTEIIAGLTTFLAMAYILIVNPSMLATAGMDQNAVLLATALSAAIATLWRWPPAWVLTLTSPTPSAWVWA